MGHDAAGAVVALLQTAAASLSALTAGLIASSSQSSDDGDPETVVSSVEPAAESHSIMGLPIEASRPPDETGALQDCLVMVLEPDAVGVGLGLVSR